MSNRKYTEVKGYWVYSIKIKSINKFYIGVSKQQCWKRWCKSGYKTTVLNQYLDEWGEMEKIVIQDNLTKEEALKKEDELIQELSKKGLCINEQRSGLITSDINVYYREKRKNNTKYNEQHKQRSKQWRLNNREKYNEYQRQRRLKKKLEREQQTVVH